MNAAWVPVALAAVWAIAGCAAQADESPGSEAASAVIATDDGVFDFGHADLAKVGSEGIAAAWAIQNRTAAPVVIRRLIASCGCVDLMPQPPFTVDPYATREIFATFTTDTPGSVAHSVRVLAGEPAAALELRVVGEVRAGHSLETDRVLFTDRQVGGLLVTIRSQPDVRVRKVEARWQETGELAWEAEPIRVGTKLDDAGEVAVHDLNYAVIVPTDLPCRSGILEISAAGLSSRVRYRCHETASVDLRAGDDHGDLPPGES